MSETATTEKRRKSPKNHRNARRAILGLTLLYIFLLAGISFCNWLGPERWWASGLNMYLPQWPWALPGICLAAAALRYCWKWAWLPVFSLFWVAGPIMGFCWGAGEASGAPPGSVKLRVMSYNVKWCRRSVNDIAAEIVRNDPDLLMVQDAGDSLRGVIGEVLKGWHTREFRQYVVASKYPFDNLTVGYIPYQNETHTYVRTGLHVKGVEVTLVDVHLVTPRSGLEAMKSEGEDGIWNLERNIKSRLIQTDKLVKDLADIDGPLILAGDLNAPVQSMVCKKLADAGLRDAFSTAGTGYGYTYGHLIRRLRHSYIRIDHIMVNDGLKVQKCWAGAPEGADHRPVIADLVLDFKGNREHD